VCSASAGRRTRLSLFDDIGRRRNTATSDGNDDSGPTTPPSLPATIFGMRTLDVEILGVFVSQAVKFVLFSESSDGSS
jgi:hypothetical protein